MKEKNHQITPEGRYPQWIFQLCYGENLSMAWGKPQQME
jgi:hypothetical protein